MTCIKLLLVFLFAIINGQETFGYSYCSGTNNCPTSRFWCCMVPDDDASYLTERQCCKYSCSRSDYSNYCSDEPPSSYTPPSTVVVAVPTIIAIIVIAVIVVVVIRICCCATRRPPVLGRPQQTVTVIRQGVTSPPMQHNPYQTGGVGIHPPPPTSSIGYTNTGFIPGNPGGAYPPVSTAYPPVSTAYPPVSNMGYQAQGGPMPPVQAPPPPYTTVDPNNKQPAFNPTNY